MSLEHVVSSSDSGHLVSIGGNSMPSFPGIMAATTKVNASPKASMTPMVNTYQMIMKPDLVYFVSVSNSKLKIPWNVVCHAAGVV